MYDHDTPLYVYDVFKGILKYSDKSLVFTNVVRDFDIELVMPVLLDVTFLLKNVLINIQ